MSDRPFMITGPFVLGEILERNRQRANADRVARMLGIVPRRRRRREPKTKSESIAKS